MLAQINSAAVAALRIEATIGQRHFCCPQAERRGGEDSVAGSNYVSYGYACLFAEAVIRTDLLLPSL
jgi:hypothetical protein